MPARFADGNQKSVPITVLSADRLESWLAEAGRIAAPEMLKTFNCGIGMVLVVAPERAEALAALLGEAGETVFRLGEVGGDKGIRYRGELA